MSFDPDAYLAGNPAPTSFDPDAYLQDANATGFVRGTVNAFKRGMAQSANASDFAVLADAASGPALAPRAAQIQRMRPGLRDPAEIAQSQESHRGLRETRRVHSLAELPAAIARREAEIEALPQTKGKVAFDEAQSLRDALKAFARNPLDVIAGLSAESLPASFPSLALGAAGSFLGPGGTAAGAGLGSLNSEMAATIMDEVKQAGGDFNQPETVRAIIADQEQMAAIRTKALKRGLPIAAFDALSAGLAGIFFKKPAKSLLKKIGQGGAELAMQAGAGGAGEAAGAVAAGDEIDGKAVLAEMLGEVGSGATETATGVVRERFRARTDDTGLNKPERPADLRAQQQQLVKHDRAVQMFPLGTSELPLPAGIQRVETPRGVFHYNPRQMTADEILSASQEGRENELLGLGPFSKPEVLRRAQAGEPMATVVERGPNGEELRGATVVPSTAEATLAAMEENKSVGSTVKLERIEETLAHRDLTAEIERDLPDTDSRDYVRGRNTQEIIAQAKEPTDHAALWKETVEAVLQRGATPNQIRGIENTLAVLTNKKARQEAGLRGLKITRERIANVLANTLMDGALRGSTFAKVTDALARSPENITALRNEFLAVLDRAAEDTPAQPASSLSAEGSGTNGPTATPTPAALPTQERELAEQVHGWESDMKAGRLGAGDMVSRLRAQLDREFPGWEQRDRERRGAEKKQKQLGYLDEAKRSGNAKAVTQWERALDRDSPRWRAEQPAPTDHRARLRAQVVAEVAEEKRRDEEIDRKRKTAQKALADAAEKRDAEQKRMAHINRTGRDPESGLIADLQRVPTRELENFDWDKDRYLHEGDEVRIEDIDALLMARGRAEERKAANSGDYTLLDLLKGRRSALQAAGLSGPLRLMSPKAAREQGMMAGEHAVLRERTGGFAYFARDGLAEDYLRDRLAELGFDAPDVNAAYDLVERAMNGEEIWPSRSGENDAIAQFARRGQPTAQRDTLAVIEGKIERGAVDRDNAARAVNRFLDVQEGKAKWPTKLITKKRWVGNRTRVSSELEPASVTEDEARALTTAVQKFDRSDGRFTWPNDDLRKKVVSNFARRGQDQATRQASDRARWLKNLQQIAPGLAQEIDLRVGEIDQLVSEGVARRSELTGEEEAARWRDQQAKKEIVFLVAQALAKNTDTVTRLNLLHEIGHIYWDTIDRDAQMQLHDLFLRETGQVENVAPHGPLFDEEGSLRANVALGATEDVQEWFAERMAHANDSFAKRRIDTWHGHDESLIKTIAAKLRALILRAREMLERHLGRNGFNDALLADFRALLDQGAKWGTAPISADEPTFARRSPDEQERAENLVQSWQAIAADARSFQFPKTDAKTPEEIARDMSVPGREIEGKERWNGEIVFSGRHDPETKEARGWLTLTRHSGNVWEADATKARPLGAQLYQAAFTWAHNNGQVVKGYILTDINILRRTSNMLSSALRHGTTKHVIPSPEQGVQWSDDDNQNIAALARRELELVLQKVPAVQEWGYDLRSGTVRDNRGVEVTSADLARFVDQAGGGADGERHGIGPATLTRAILSKQLDGSDPSAVRAALENLARKTGAAERVLYARRKLSFDDALRTFDKLERERDRLNSAGEKVPRDLLEQLSEARTQLENSWPGWREERAETTAQDAANALTAPEAEKGVTADEDDGREVRPEVTSAKVAALMASHHKPVGRLQQWLDGIGRMFANFRSSVPELPGGAEGRKFTRFRQGHRMMKAATEVVRREAEDRIAHVLEPISRLEGDPVSPDEYRRLINLQAAIRKLDQGAETPAETLKVAPQINKLTAEMEALEAKLETRPYHLFRKIVLLRDLWFRGKLLNLSGEPLTLPFNLTREGVEDSLRRLHDKLGSHEQRSVIEDALKRHYELVKSTRSELLARGYVIPEELRNPLYFPHLILDKFNGRLQRVKMDTSEDFRAYLQQLTGSAKDIEADYLTAMYYHMGQVLAHNARQDIVAAYWQPYDIKPALVDDAARVNEERAEQGLGPLVWQQLVPKDHTIYAVDDRIPLRPEYTINRRVLAERLGVELGDGDLQARLRELGLNVTITAEDVRQAMMAGEKTVWVLPREVAAALDGIMERETHSRDQLRSALALPQTAWKWWKLFSPTSVIRYNYGNMVSDVEKLFSADPRVFRYLLPAYREVKDFVQGGEGTADLREAFKRGVLQSPTAAETGDLVRADRFEVFLSSAEKLRNTLARGVQWGQYVSSLRESAFRYAKFKVDLERLRSGEKPVYAGAFSRDVEAITGDDATFAKAAKIARETFVDYDAISVSGDSLRRYWVPFYSWMEGNFRYHANLFHNLADMSVGAGMAQLARGGLVAASKVVLPRSVTGVLLRLALPYVAVAMWNSSGDRDEIEKDLSEEDRRRFHIILGRDEKGKALVVYAPTALSDVAEWFGGNEFARLATEYFAGRITFDQLTREWLANTPKQTLNKAAQSTNPFFKTLLEFVSRKGYFPDVTEARSIPDYDMTWHVLGNMTDHATADLIRRAVDSENYSSKSVGEWAQQLIFQARRRDPEQWGYYSTLDRVAEWKLAHGGGYEPGADNREEAKLLRSFRRAIRSADVPAATEFYHRLLKSGYTAERFAASVRSGDPLQTLKREQRQEFYNSLNDADRHNLKNAYRYWQRLEVFRNREARLFASEKASAGYKQRFADAPRDDVFAGLMFDAATRPDEDEELRAEALMKSALRPR